MSNSISVSGVLVREPELRYTRQGQANVLLSLSVDTHWHDAETGDEVGFFDVICREDLAEHVALSLTRGSRCMVTGRLHQRNWETELAERRSKIEIVADEVGASLLHATVEVHRHDRHPAGAGTE